MYCNKNCKELILNRDAANPYYCRKYNIKLEMDLEKFLNTKNNYDNPYAMSWIYAAQECIDDNIKMDAINKAVGSKPRLHCIIISHRSPEQVQLQIDSFFKEKSKEQIVSVTQSMNENYLVVTIIYEE